MASQKSTVEPPATAKAPTRKRGRERVAQLLEAGAEVFAEHGFAAATMTEIAARAGASIGSLYQFFPNKDLLADALVERYGVHVFERLDALEAEVERLSAEQLADGFRAVFRDLAAERALALSLLDARWQKPGARPGLFRKHIRNRIASILRRWRPDVDAEAAAVHAVVVLQIMKADIQLAEEATYPAKKAAETVWRRMLVSYLEDLRS